MYFPGTKLKTSIFKETSTWRKCTIRQFLCRGNNCDVAINVYKRNLMYLTRGVKEGECEEVEWCGGVLVYSGIVDDGFDKQMVLISCFKCSLFVVKPS